MYPSLLRTLNYKENRIESFVFDDLKLSLLISPSCAEIMRYIPVVEDILRRQEVFKELENADVYEHFHILNSLSVHMKNIFNSYDETDGEYSKKVLFVNICNTYIQFVKVASEKLDFEIGSIFCSYFANLISDDFNEFEKQTVSLYNDCKALLNREIHISNGKVHFGNKQTEGYCSVLIKALEFFDCEKNAPDIPSEYFPDICEEFITSDREMCARLNSFCDSFFDRVDSSVSRYAEETSFYLELFDLIVRIRTEKIPTVMPVFTDRHIINASKVYDFTLLAKKEKNIVPNNINLAGDSEFCFLCGANGGGKTTYLRTVGVNTLLALSGCYTASDYFELSDFDAFFTHFPSDERFDRMGRLSDEEIRLESIVSCDCDKKLVLLNETFSTTMESISEEKTLLLAEKLCKSGFIGIYVTHCNLSRVKNIPILCVCIDSSDQNARTFKIAMNGKQETSYAEDILRKYSLDRMSLERRFGIL